MTDCLFCNIVAGGIPADIVFSDEHVVVFRDIHPQTRVHLLIIPRTHLESLAALEEQHQPLIAHMMLLLPQLAHAQGLNNGFRTVINTGPGGGQEIPHLHIHLTGGARMPGF